MVPNFLLLLVLLGIVLIVDIRGYLLLGERDHLILVTLMCQLWPCSPIYNVGQDWSCYYLLLLKVIVVHLGQTKHSIVCLIRHLLLLLRLLVFIIHRLAA